MAQQPVLWVEIVPTTRGIGKKIEAEFQEGFDATEKAGGQMFSRVAGFARGAATAIVATTVGAIGAAIAKGFGRLNSIDVAQAKLKGLGNDAATVETIMKNALASVKGTAFGLGDAASVAASAVAAGVQPGKSLETYLKAVANGAAAAGTGLDEMGEIFAKVAASGKAQNDVLGQVADKGLGIYQALASQLGVTTDEVFKLASEGKISAAQFEQAMATAAGTVADEMGKTVPGALKNLDASLGRIGAGLLGGTFPLLAPLIQSVTGAMLPLEDRATAIGTAIGEKLTPFVEGLRTALSSALPDLSGIAGILGPLAGGFAALGAGGLAGLISQVPLLSGLAGPLTALGGPLGILLGALAGLVAVSPQLRESLGAVVMAVFGAFASIAARLAPVLDALLPVVAALAIQLGDSLGRVLLLLTPVIADVAGLVGDVLVRGLAMLMPSLGLLGDVFSAVVVAALPLVQVLVSRLMPVFEAIVPLVLGVLAAVLPLAVTLVEALLPVFEALVPAILPLVGALLPALVLIISSLLPIFDAVLPIVVQLIESGLVPLVGIFGELISSALPLLTPLLELVTELLGALLPILAPLIEIGLKGLSTALAFLLPYIMEVVSGLGDSLIPIISAVAQTLGGLITFLTGVFTGDWQKAWSGIKDVVAGQFNAIVAIVKGVINLVIDQINGAIAGINGIIGQVGGAIGLDVRVPRIPRLAKGGVVPAVPGGMTAVLGEGRYDEMVLPLGGPIFEELRAALGGGTPVYVQNPFTGEYLLAQVADVADERVGAYDTRVSQTIRGGVRR